jgi:hypothetical protein
MINTDDKHVLFIEPKGPSRFGCVDDVLTLGMEFLLKNAKQGPAYRGFHQCCCGEISGSCDLILPDGSTTNSLAAHYLRYHRDEVPRSELAKVTYLVKTYAREHV